MPQLSYFLLVLICAVFQTAEPRCGIPRIRHQALIRHAVGTQPGAWPWHAAILHLRGRSFVYACGGTLINEDFVVTADHCLYSKETETRLARRKLRVRLGAYNLEVSNINTVREYAVAGLYTPDQLNMDNMRNDIALIELTEPVVPTSFILPACISAGIRMDRGTVVGWGNTENDTLSPVLKKAVLPVVGAVECLDSDRDLFGGMIHKNMFCAGFLNGTSVCNGDSGGGLFFELNGAWFLGGIVSFSKRRGDGTGLCHTESYAGFTNVSSYVPWIQSITGMLESSSVRNGLGELRISERKCLEYMSYRTLPYTWATAIIRQVDHTCLTTLISERLLLTTDNCVNKDVTQYPASATISFSWNNLFDPELNLTMFNRTAGINRVFWIDTETDIEKLKQHVTCLWTDPEPITSDVVADVYSPDVRERYWSNGKNVQLMDTGSGVVIVNDTTKCSERFMGAELRVKRHGEDFYRLVGPLIDCEPSTYVRLTPHLDSMEKSVWD